VKLIVITTTSLAIVALLLSGGRAVSSPQSSGLIFSEQRKPENAKPWTVSSITVTPSEDLVDVEMLDQKNGKALSDQGSIFETADGGKSWQRLGEGLSGSQFVRICFIDKLVGWALSWKTRPASGSLVPQYDALLLHTQNGGLSWTVQHTVNNGSLNEIIFSNRHEGWAVGRTIQRADGVETERVLVLRTVDQGRHWQDLSDNLGQESSTGSAEDIISGGPSKAVILTSQDSILSTRDAGQSWRKMKAAKSDRPQFVNLRLVADAADRLFVLSSTNSREVIGSRVARVDENHRWVVTDLPDWYLNDLKILSPGEMFVSGLTGEKYTRRAVERGQGILAFSSDGGRSWAEIHRTRKSARINALAIVDPNKLLAVGDGGWIFSIERISSSL
jgi:photosystem II stability/assembly factor-like uncharacterized protein